MKWLILSAALLIAACASTTAQLSQTQCTQNWGAVGVADGEDGARADKLAGYVGACSRAGAALTADDQSDWRAGYAKGLDAYCEAGAVDRRCGDQVAAAGGGHTHAGHRHGRYGYRYGYPRIRPQIGVGVGRGGVRVGAGLGIDFGILNLGIFF